MTNPKTVGIYPAGSLTHYKRLLSGLEKLYPIRFEEAHVEKLEQCDAILLFAQNSALLQHAESIGIRAYAISGDSETYTRSSQVRFGVTEALNIHLRGQTLADSHANALHVIATEPTDDVLAYSGGDPIWVLRYTDKTSIDLVSMLPDELGEGEFLRDHLTAGRFVRLLPLIHFLREITADQAWTPPPLRACYIFDDPNLHRFSYGFLHYRKLIAHAEQYNYHAAIAMIPFDGWWINRKVANFLRQQPERVSLLIHGNNHLYHELNGEHTDSQALAELAQALERIDQLEKSTQLSVSRVMAPPHGTCSPAMVRAMMLLGFEAVSMNPFRNRTLQDQSLAGWDVADMGEHCFPLIPRFIFTPEIYDNIPLTAFLNQPIICAGHHYDAANQMAAVEEWVARVNSLGAVQWQSMRDIARSNYMTRVAGETLFVRLSSRHVSLKISQPVQSIVVEVAAPDSTEEVDEVIINGIRTPLLCEGQYSRTDPIAVIGSENVEIRLCNTNAIAYQDVPHPPTNRWAIARRILTEARDRISFYHGGIRDSR